MSEIEEVYEEAMPEDPEWLVCGCEHTECGEVCHVALRDAFAELSSHAEYHSFYEEFVPLTPELAEALLKIQFSKQRSKKRTSYKNVASHIEAGSFMWRIGKLGFDTEGYMVDGQNRCIAVASAGIAVPMWFSFGWTSDEVKAIDTNSARSGGDILKIDDVKNASRIYSIARSSLVGLTTWRPSKKETTDHAKQFQDVFQRFSGKAPHAPAAVCAAFANAVILGGYDIGQVGAAYDDYRSEIHATKRCALKALRKRVTSRISNRVVSSAIKYAWAVRAVRHYLSGSGLSYVKLYPAFFDFDGTLRAPDKIHNDDGTVCNKPYPNYVLGLAELKRSGAEFLSNLGLRPNNCSSYYGEFIFSPGSVREKTRWAPRYSWRPDKHDYMSALIEDEA